MVSRVAILQDAMITFKSAITQKAAALSLALWEEATLNICLFKLCYLPISGGMALLYPNDINHSVESNKRATTAFEKALIMRTSNILCIVHLI